MKQNNVDYENPVPFESQNYFVTRIELVRSLYVLSFLQFTFYIPSTPNSLLHCWLHGIGKSEMCVCNTRERCTLHRTAEASAAEVNVHTELTREVMQGYWPSSGNTAS